MDLTATEIANNILQVIKTFFLWGILFFIIGLISRKWVATLILANIFAGLITIIVDLPVLYSELTSGMGTTSNMVGWLITTLFFVYLPTFAGNRLGNVAGKILNKIKDSNL